MRNILAAALAASLVLIAGPAAAVDLGFSSSAFQWAYLWNEMKTFSPMGLACWFFIVSFIGNLFR